jgi:hypothetical protein
MPCVGEMEIVRKSVLYSDYTATLRAASLREARCNNTISAEQRFDIVLGLKRGLVPSMVVEFLEMESISPEVTFTKKRPF